MYSRPRAIRATDRVGEFSCGEPTLDNWLQMRAIRNETSGASRTFVSIDSASDRVAGYYCLSASSIALEDAAGKLRRNMPDPIPVLLVGRLAVDHQFRGTGLGVSLLQDAVLKAIEVSRTIGTRAILAHALSESAESFYVKFGFSVIPHSTRAMYLLVQDAEATLATLA